MNSTPETPAAFARPSAHELVLSGCWTACGIGTLDESLKTLSAPESGEIVVDGEAIASLDTAGAWILQRALKRLGAAGVSVQLRAWPPGFAKLMDIAAKFPDAPAKANAPRPTLPENVGRYSVRTGEQALEFLSFVGECALAVARGVARPARLRWRPILYNIRTAGWDALPIVGALSFLIGLVVAYQSANRSRTFGANIFIADVVGLSVLREFAPLMTAIIVAGRSGSAYTAQIGTMAVTEEVDAMRTIAIAPLDMLMLPKLLALVFVLPLLTVYADVLGVFGGMIMAATKLGVSFEDFLDRFVNAVSVTDYLIGIGKAPVFAAIIVIVGCFQGFRTRGGADAVGRQTTRSVVHGIFLVIVADALFSIVFSILDL